jgi:hypothetical protein
VTSLTSRHGVRAHVLLGAFVGALAITPAHAQETRMTGAQSCIEVDVEGTRSLSFDCLNASLQAAALSAPPPTHVYDVYDAVGSGAPTQVGTFSFTATAIQMGNAFGHSAFPQRPAAPVYSNPIVGVR